MSESFNAALVCGRLSSDPRARDLPSGTRLVQLEVTVAVPDRRADSVPVVVFDPPAALDDLGEGDPVVVVGRVRRRFFRAGGATVSRTEVVASHVVRATRRAAVRRACRALGDHLDVLRAG